MAGKTGVKPIVPDRFEGSMDAARRSALQGQTSPVKTTSGASGISTAFSSISGALISGLSATARIGQAVAQSRSGQNGGFSSGQQTTLPAGTPARATNTDSGITTISSVSPSTDGGAAMGGMGNIAIMAAVAFAVWKLA